jgi:hypothetical protein
MSYDPYKKALSLLQDKLVLEDIDIVKENKDEKLISLFGEGFNVERLKDYLIKFQLNKFKVKRTSKNYSGYEVLQCLRKSYYNRQGIIPDKGNVAQYPYSIIKAVMGCVVEELLFSMYNQCEGTKYRNGVELKLDIDKKWGTLFPFYGVADGITYDHEIISDVKFSDNMDPFHKEQLYLYASIYEAIRGEKCIKKLENIYINSNLNSVSVMTYEYNDDIRETKERYFKERIMYLDNCLRNKTLPGPEKDKCNFCPYLNTCEGRSKPEQVDSKESLGIQDTKNKDNMLEEGYQETKKGTQLKIDNHPKETDIKILL